FRSLGMVGRAWTCFIYIYIFIQIAVVSVGSKSDWSTCNIHSCFVPGTCAGSIERQLNLMRYPPENCEIGMIVKIE
ncbi:hypothetical protein PFISCL1PPCAC_6638, partial [Pristionchus fissidentatus]